MKNEIEATFLEVNHDLIRDNLKKLGAILKIPEALMKRAIYDYPNLSLDKEASWVRVRQEGEYTTLTYKRRLSETIYGMQEIEVRVDDFEKTCSFLKAIGMTEKAHQESKREVWAYDDCEIMLDEWPWIPKYIEIEGPNKPIVKETSIKLGFDFRKAIFDSTDAIYKKYFDVSRTEISSVPIIFGPIPKWLNSKRIK